jgi:hypothetical protein
VGFSHIRNESLFGPTFLTGPDHDRGAVGVVGAHEDAPVAAELLEPDPDIGLDVFNQMPDVDVPVGVREGGGDEDAAF